jgi:hypothetical protein
MAKKAKSVSDTTEKKLANLKVFKPGSEWTGNAKGRPRGSRNKLGEDFIAAMHADFEAHGADTIKRVREERPADYVKVIAGILPKELNVTTNALEELSDDDLAAGIAALQSVLAAHEDADGSEPETKH